MTENVAKVVAVDVGHVVRVVADLTGDESRTCVGESAFDGDGHSFAREHHLRMVITRCP